MSSIESFAGNQLFADTIKLHYKKNRTMQDAFKEHEVRKENPVLDQMLYDADKADMLGEMSEAKTLLTKIARGEKLTEREKKFLKEKYPELVEKAKMAKTQADMVKERMKNARSKSERQDIVAQAYAMVGSSMKMDPMYGELLGEGIKKAISDQQGEGNQLDIKREKLDQAEELRKRFEQNSAHHSLFESRR